MSNISQDLCVRLQELRQRCYGSRGRSAFARDLAIPVSTYILYEQSRMPPADVLVRAAHVTGANLQWLMTGQGLQKIPNQMVVHPITARFDAILSARPELEKQAVELLRMLESLAQDIPARQKESQEYLSKHVALTSGISQGHPKNLLPSATLLPVVGSTSAGPAGYWADLPELAAGPNNDQRLENLLSQLTNRETFAAETIGLAAADRVALIQFARPDEYGLLEFLDAPAIKRAFPDAFAWRIDGDSMAPRYQDGDFVITSLGYPAVVNHPAVIRQQGQIGASCKTFQIVGDEALLIPINERYPTQKIPRSTLVWTYRVLSAVRLTRPSKMD